MTNAEIIATIRAEIYDLQTKWETSDAMADGLLSFLDTLESEKQMDLEGLEEELDRYLHGEFQQTAGGNFNNYIQVARHFAEWGAEHLKK